MPSGSTALIFGARFEQDLRALDASLARGEQQRSQAAQRQPLVARLGCDLPFPLVDVRDARSRPRRARSVPSPSPDAARRRPTSAPSARAIPRARPPSRRGRAAPSRLRRLPVRATVISAVSPSVDDGVRVGPGFEQPFDHRGIRVHARQIERSDAVAIRGLDVGARAQQPIGQFDVVCRTAQCSGVVPSGSATLTSAFCAAAP